MEVELTESSEIILKTDNLAVTEEADVDESIPIYLLKEQKKLLLQSVPQACNLCRRTQFNNER